MPKMRACLALTAALALAACQVAPATGREGFNIVPQSQEAAMGAEAHPDVLKQFGGAYDDPQVQAWVAGLGQTLVTASETPTADFRFTVLNSDIVNAMALPGGYIYVTRGLLALADDEAELAGVLAHEIGHVTGRHTSQRMSRAAVGDLLAGVLGAVVGVPGVGEVAQLGAGAYLQGFSRDQESEADQLGLRYMSQAGYDPHAMVSFLQKLQQSARLEAVLAGRPADQADQFSFMASHPRTADRVQAAATATEGIKPGGQRGREALLQHVDGLLYGSDPKEGLVRGQEFLHPGLGFRFQVPPGFRLVNGEDKVTAGHPEGGVIQFDTDRGGGDMVSYLGGQWGARLRLQQIEPVQMGGLSGATGRTQANTEAGPAELRLVAIDGGDGTIYRFLFVQPAGSGRFDEGYRRTTYSFRRLTSQEAASIRPYRIKVVPRRGESDDALAARMAVKDHALERFRLLNGREAGEKVKIVVED